MIRVWLLGEAKVEKDGSEITEWGNTTYARQVFLWLITHDKRASRTTITDALWPETACSTAEAHLSKSISHLRKLFGSDSIRTTRHRSGYEIIGDIWVDLDACNRLILEAEKDGRFTEKAVEYLEQAARLLDRGACLESESWSWCHAIRAPVEDAARCCRSWLVQAYENVGLYLNAQVQRRHLDPEGADDMNRRQILQGLLTMPLMPVGSPIDCALGLDACWRMVFEGRISEVSRLLPVYQAYIVGIAHQKSLVQKQMFGLASQVFQIHAKTRVQKEDLETTRAYLNIAWQYAEASGDPNQQAVVLIRIANAWFHSGAYTQAEQVYNRAIPLAKNATPLLRGYVYTGLAEVCAFLGKFQDAMAYMGLAYEYYPEIPANDPAYPYTRYGRYDLVMFGEGQTRLALGQVKQARDVFEAVEKSGIGDKTDPLTEVDLEYYKALASVRLGILDTNQLMSAAQLAAQAGSKLYISKNKATLLEMRKRWPNELKLKKLELPAAQLH